MKKMLCWLLSTVITCAISLAQGYADSVWMQGVRSVQLYLAGSPMEPPLLVLGQGGGVVLEFDLLGAEPQALRWRLVHCDRYWRPDSLEANDFMLGFAQGGLDHYDFSFNTRTDYVHYSLALPEQYAEFTHSGNYLVVVYREELGDDFPIDRSAQGVVLTRRLQVAEQAVKIVAEVAAPFDGIDRERRQEVDVLLSSKQMMLNEMYLSVMVQQNGLTSSQRELQFSGYQAEALAYRHRKANIFDGGNTFRFFDFSDLRARSYGVQQVQEYGGELFVRLRREENRSRKHYLSEVVLNGGMKINTVDRQNAALESEYAWVCFMLPSEQPFLDGSVHIVGALTDWRLDEASRMDYDPSQKAYTKCLYLKQGYYAYQLLFQGRGLAAQSLTERLEGNHRETSNRYTVSVYHRSPADRADRLIGVGTVVP